MRLYQLFEDLTQVSGLSYQQYWDVKRKKISNEAILKFHLGYDQNRIHNFLADWMILIEAPPYLALDSSFTGIPAFLDKLKQHADLYVCTARQFRQPAMDQLARLNLLHNFKQVLVTEQRQSKVSLIESYVSSLSERDWLVGDTGKDIQAGKLLNIKTCAVLSGFLNEKALQSYEPDWIIESVTSFSPADICLNINYLQELA